MSEVMEPRHHAAAARVGTSRRPLLPAPAAHRPGQLLVAVVHSERDVRFVAVSAQMELLAGQLAQYVRDRAPDALWPDDAAAVRALLDAGDHHRAVERYLDAVGDRWDPEWLTVTAVGSETPRRR